VVSGLEDVRRMAGTGLSSKQIWLLLIIFLQLNLKLVVSQLLVQAYLAKFTYIKISWRKLRRCLLISSLMDLTSNNLKYGLVPYYDDMFRGANDSHQGINLELIGPRLTGSIANANPEFQLNFHTTLVLPVLVTVQILPANIYICDTQNYCGSSILDRTYNAACKQSEAAWVFKCGSFHT
jgi:hypothetical protein